MVDWAAARLADVERTADSACGAHRGAMGRKREPGGPHHGQEMAERGWSEAGGELEGRWRFGAHRRGDTDAER
jgi:hypothetical protein